MEEVSIEDYQNGGVYARAYRYADHSKNKFYLRIGGCCYLEVKEKELIELWQFLDSYVGEIYPGMRKKKRWWNRG